MQLRSSVLTQQGIIRNKYFQKRAYKSLIFATILKHTEHLSKEVTSAAKLTTAMQSLVLLTTLLLIAFRTVELCEPDFGTDYRGCDLKQYQNVRSWKECSRICSPLVVFIGLGPILIPLTDH